MKLELKKQFDILNIGNNRILSELQALGLTSPTEIAECFSFTREDFLGWCDHFELDHFCQLKKGTGDGLYLIQKSPQEWEMFWQEREMPQGIVETFKSEREAKIFTIATRLNVWLRLPVLLELSTRST